MNPEKKLYRREVIKLGALAAAAGVVGLAVREGRAEHVAKKPMVGLDEKYKEHQDAYDQVAGDLVDQMPDPKENEARATLFQIDCMETDFPGTEYGQGPEIAFCSEPRAVNSITFPATLSEEEVAALDTRIAEREKEKELVATPTQ